MYFFWLVLTVLAVNDNLKYTESLWHIFAVKCSASAKAPGFGSSRGLYFSLPCYALQLLVVIF